MTCNYEARRRGLHKLQLINEARKICPDVVIVLGEDLTRFRNASKELYAFLSSKVWTGRAERLGFDEVFLDVTDMIDYNTEILNHNDLSNAFFHLDRNDPTIGFSYDASITSGNCFPSKNSNSSSMSDLSSPRQENADDSSLRLRLGSHLAQHLRQQLDEEQGYTATVGISTNKLLSKLVGNVHKPRDQTTLMPPYYNTASHEAVHHGSVHRFLDTHEIGKIPGIGFKLSRKIREHILGREATFESGLIYGSTQENVTVRDVRLCPNMGSELLENLLGGPGSPKGIGTKVWGLINGVDNAEVGRARIIPRQISIEDSYIRLDTMEEVKKELQMLAISLLRRMLLDLTIMHSDKGDPSHEDEEESTESPDDVVHRRWLAHPRTLRLTTRPRPPLNPDGSRSRSFSRISHSGPFPNFVFDLKGELAHSAERLVSESLIPLFRKLHREKSGWNLSLINIAVTNLVTVASDDKEGSGRDIGKMFRRQEDLLKDFKVEDRDVPPSEQIERQHIPPDVKIVYTANPMELPHGSEEDIIPTQTSFNGDEAWDSDGDDPRLGDRCKTCGAMMPQFAMAAHERFHTQSD